MTHEEANKILKKDIGLCRFNPISGENVPMNQGCRTVSAGDGDGNSCSREADSEDTHNRNVHKPSAIGTGSVCLPCLRRVFWRLL